MLDIISKALKVQLIPVRNRKKSVNAKAGLIGV